MVRVDLEHSFPVGIRFHPTDEELLNHYLKLKTLGSDSDVRAIPVVDICNWEPWELPAVFLLHFSITSPNFSGLQWNDHRWYFFCPRDGICRVNRSTNSGYWKPTGTDRMIESRDTGDLIGSKRTLVFYEGRLRNSHRTNWVINEYQLNPEMAFVLCVLKRNKDGNARGEAEPSSDNGTDLSHITTAPPNNSPQPNHVASGAENHVVEESLTELSPEEQAFLRHVLHNEPIYTDQPEQEPSAMDFQNPNGFSKTDTDVLQSRNDPIRHVSMLQAGSSNSPRYRRENICFLGDESGASSASSVDSTADKPFEINSIDLISPKFPLNNTTTGRPQYQPIRSPIAVAQMSASPKIYAQEVLHKEPNRGKVRESSCILAKHGGRPDSVKARATATELPEKENSNVVSKNDLGMAGGGNTKLRIKSREQKEPSGRNQKGSINFVETLIASRYRLSPPHCLDVKDSKSSSETDTEGLQLQIDPILETFRSLNINSHGGISQGQSSNSRQYRRENIGVLRNESGGSSASSVDSIADIPFVASRLQLPSPNFPINNTRLHYSVAQRIASQKVCMKEVIHKEPCQGKVGGSSCIAEKHEGKPDSVKVMNRALPEKLHCLYSSGNLPGNNTDMTILERQRARMKWARMKWEQEQFQQQQQSYFSGDEYRVAAEDESGDKRIKVCAEEGESKIAEQNINKNYSSSINNNRETSADTLKENSKVTEVQKPDYIHVRACCGQATDSQSLAERVRREKISERMKYLQDLVPGCNKITGKAGMLDEIINYVQSLQRQVEFLSMKLAVNPRLDFNIDNFITGNVSVCQDSII